MNAAAVTATYHHHHLGSTTKYTDRKGKEWKQRLVVCCRAKDRRLVTPRTATVQQEDIIFDER